MTADDPRAAAKRRAGESAVDGVTDGVVVGLGTGSTAAYAIRELGRAVDAGLDVRGVPTSYQARSLALEVGIPVVGLDEERPDLAIDGADEVTAGALRKGGGAAHAREKVVAAAADRFLVVVDESKLSDAISGPIPLEVISAARQPVGAAVESLGGDSTLRAAEHKDGPIVTDNGNLVLDCDFGRIDDPATLAADLDRLPGVLEHGLFVGLSDEVHVGRSDGLEVLDR